MAASSRFIKGNRLLQVLSAADRGLLEPDLTTVSLSTPEQKCIGWPEQKCIKDAGKKAPELGAFSSGIRLGSDCPPACPSWRGVSGACSD